jgi:hypothetical protein
VVQGKAPFRNKAEHAGDNNNNTVAAWRSKPEGVAAGRHPYFWNLMLSRLGRCREAPGVTANDAILTLKILLIYLNDVPALAESIEPMPPPLN